MYNPKTFFKHTYCEFKTTEFNFSEVKNYTSKSGSVYHYTEKGVYRYSNHWGRVANCRWKLTNVEQYKNQNWYVGYADWTDFYDLQSLEKICYLKVDIDKQKVFICLDNTENHFLFSIQEAMRRKKEIMHFFNHAKWLKYVETDNINVLKKQILKELAGSNKKMKDIKRHFS